MSTPSVDELVGRDEWDAVNRTQRRPFVVYKFAATLDGRIAAEDGSRKGLDLAEVLGGLFVRGVRAVFLEGGPTLAGSFIEHGFVDRVVNYVAPALLGSGKSGLENAGITTMADILRLDLLHVAHSGTDIRLVGRPSQESTPGRAPAAGGGSGRRAW